MKRRITQPVYVGDVQIGGNSPISIQSMTKTDTRDVKSTVKQIKELEETKKHIINGSLSLRGAAEQLEHKTGRKISYVGLKKIVDKSKVKSLLDKRNI